MCLKEVPFSASTSHKKVSNALLLSIQIYHYAFSQGRSLNFEEGTLSFKALSTSEMHLCNHQQLIYFEHQGNMIQFHHLQICLGQGFHKFANMSNVPHLYNSNHLSLSMLQWQSLLQRKLNFSQAIRQIVLHQIDPFPPGPIALYPWLLLRFLEREKHFHHTIPYLLAITELNVYSKEPHFDD